MGLLQTTETEVRKQDEMEEDQIDQEGSREEGEGHKPESTGEPRVWRLSDRNLTGSHGPLEHTGLEGHRRKTHLCG